MPYLIDGHNLVPKAGLRLDFPDDETRLVNLLNDFSRMKKQPVEVYFDGAPIGQAGMRKMGAVRAHFIKKGTTADAAIRARLAALGREARNWIVVSSDHAVQSFAHGAQAKAITSEEFVQLMKKTAAAHQIQAREKPNPNQSEVEEWLELFKNGKKQGK